LECHYGLNMGQQEVYDFLKKNKGKWWTSKEIANKIDASVGSVTTTLTKLRKIDDVSFKMSKEKTNMFLYMFKK
jgi:predicted transcriptional regulator